MDHGLLHGILNPLKLLVQKPAYRTLFFLKARYSNAQRRKESIIRCFGYTLRVPDLPSFVYQFKDIFVEEYYRFECDNALPTIIDCGANIGTSCLYYKMRFPNTRIIAIEADPSIAGILKENLEKNSISDVTIVNKAAWIHNDGVEFSPDGADGGSIFGSTNKVHIPSVRLRDIILDAGHVDFLKVDIEGAEVDVIADCAECLVRVDRLYIEYHSWKGQTQRLDKLLSTLTTSGFTYYVQSIFEHATPLRYQEIILDNDMQLHIFAVRNKNPQ